MCTCDLDMGRQNSSPAGALAPSSRTSTQDEDVESPAVAGSSKGLLSDKYTLGEELGRGAYGQVYTSDTICYPTRMVPDVMGVLSLSGVGKDSKHSQLSFQC